MQQFAITTLIDITETGQYQFQKENILARQQQQNFSTLIQTISLRVNPNYYSPPTVEELDVSMFGFGNKFKGLHKVWTFNFYIEYDGGFTDAAGRPQGLLEQDLNFVPVITDLTETATIKPSIFNTRTGSDRNTIILFVDINKQ